MTDDERSDRKGWLISGAMLLGALALLGGVFELRVRYASADAMDGYAFVGGELLVVDRLHGGGESSPPGGTRMFLLDPASGRVHARKRLDEGLSFLMVDHGLVWMRRYMGAFESFDASTLERRSAEKDLLRRAPALRALSGVEEGGCLNTALGAWRFTDENGKYAAFHFADETVIPVTSRDCPARNRISTSGGKLADGRSVRLQNVPNGVREALVLGEGTSARPVGSLSFLEPHLLAKGDDARELLTVGSDDVFVVRRTGTKDDAPSEVVRVGLSEARAKWSTRIDDRRANIQQADLHDGRLYLRSGSQLSVIDLESGAIRWRRGD